MGGRMSTLADEVYQSIPHPGLSADLILLVHALVV